MAKKKIPAGIGAVGSASARFFHPSNHIREKWPNDHSKKRLSGVLILGQGERVINRKMQKTYECRIPELDNGVVYHIVRRNLRLDVASPDPSNVFPEEVAAAAPAPRPLDERGSNQNAERTQMNGGRGASADEVNELRQQGITVDDEDPAPENATATPSEATANGVTICDGCSKNISNEDGKWKRFMFVPRKPHPFGIMI